jgi:hypothetical protein
MFMNEVAMASSPPGLDSDRRGNAASIPNPADHLDVDALREENKQLRELVIQLSKLVIRNVVDRP